jgi:hypothetical protein
MASKTPLAVFTATGSSSNSTAVAAMHELLLIKWG